MIEASSRTSGLLLQYLKVNYPRDLLVGKKQITTELFDPHSMSRQVVPVLKKKNCVIASSHALQ